MTQLIHEAVRRTLRSLEAQHGGTLPEGLQINHTSTAPYGVSLDCHQCRRCVDQRFFRESQILELELHIVEAAHQHPCWQPKQPMPSDPGEWLVELAASRLADCGEYTYQAAKQHAGGSLAAYRASVVSETRGEMVAKLLDYPDYRGVMGIAAALIGPDTGAPVFSLLDYTIKIATDGDDVWLTCNQTRCEETPAFGYTENGAGLRALVGAAQIHHAEHHTGGQS